ncbi:uncharacterized protein LOC115716035 [Cannabis sativa]|uniref:uncharacterized protein LOC115716035 n=1 Tax=Cannabis sativa TaxID=3483 RepID=UPI0029CA9721|nr:uncharacterized protein LOC115716035 [Cannabis sativa]
MVQQNQFGGLATEDPNIYLAIFLEVCATVKMNGVTDDAIRLRLFLISLRDRARSWLQSLQPDSLIRSNFMKYESDSKTYYVAAHNMAMRAGCKFHFSTNGLNGPTRTIIDAPIGGALLS